MVRERAAGGVYSPAPSRRRPTEGDFRRAGAFGALPTPAVNQPTFYLALAAAGGIGVLLRAGCNALALRWAASGSPWAAPAATLFVNVVGSFLFGVVYALAGPRPGLSTAWQPILLVGLLGGFTTYSTFAFQTVEMLTAGRAGQAVAYVAATNLLAVAAVWAGSRIAGCGPAS